MIRLFGFVVGSAIAIAAILLVIGLPQLPQRQPDVAIAAPEPELPAPELPAPELPAPELPAPMVQEEPVIEVVEIVEVPAPADPSWHSFWSPFGSQIAASGFVKRLEAVTGYDYRVVKIETGVYEVVFAYTDETERLDKLSVIASATGLELPDT
jgi:hypothetical protein